MFIRHFKGKPNDYILHFANGKVARQGLGISFWYWPAFSTISAVPTRGLDVPFIFTETTANFQEVTIQGTLSYRIAEPDRVAARLDFSIDPVKGHYRTEDPDVLTQRIVNAVQAHTRRHVATRSLEDALTEVGTLAADVLPNVGDEAALADIGVVVENLYFTSVRTTPEMQKALEAEYRERLQKAADQAIYARRSAAQAEERKLKQGELDTEVELETRRQELVDKQARNTLTLAEAEAKADEMKLTPYGALPPQALVGLALKEWAGNAGAISNLSITPDLLAKLVGWMSAERTPPAAKE